MNKNIYPSVAKRKFGETYNKPTLFPAHPLQKTGHFVQFTTELEVRPLEVKVILDISCSRTSLHTLIKQE